MIAIGITILFYSLFLWNVAKSDFDSLADVSPQYTVKVFTNIILYSLIYGHHMEYGRMFGALDDFLDVPYLNSHSSGTLIVGKDTEKTYGLTVFAAMRASAKDEAVFDPGKGDIRQFIKEHCETYTADTGQRILALSTCAEGDSVTRTLVFCYID